MKQDQAMERLLDAIRETFPHIALLEEEKMAAHCSFRTGGAVRALLLPGTEEELLTICTLCREAEVEPIVLGNGTNLVFPDERSDRIVLGTEKIQDLYLTPEGELFASCGVALSRLASFACENALTGLEFASGIPGTVGGGLLMNAGAYGGELKDCVKNVRVLDKKSGKISGFEKKDCDFSYRHSIFQNGEAVLLSARFSLTQGDKNRIREEMKELNRRRREKQPLEFPSAGSTFRRPEGHYAAALIEECGLKGRSIGGAKVSEKHAGFIINTGNATTEDLASLIRVVQTEVYEQKQIALQPEVIILQG